jgi:hypothetical protein
MAVGETLGRGDPSLLFGQEFNEATTLNGQLQRFSRLGRAENGEKGGETIFIIMVATIFPSWAG